MRTAIDRPYLATRGRSSFALPRRALAGDNAAWSASCANRSRDRPVYAYIDQKPRGSGVPHDRAFATDFGAEFLPTLMIEEELSWVDCDIRWSRSFTRCVRSEAEVPERETGGDVGR